MATTKYASEYLMQYDGHNTPVNNVKFNPFVPVSLRDLKKKKLANERIETRLLVDASDQKTYKVVILTFNISPPNDKCWLGIFSGQIS